MKIASPFNRIVIGLVALTLALVAGAAFILAPGQAEQASMTRRDLFARAVALKNNGDLSGAARLLERSVQLGVAEPATIRALLGIYIDQRDFTRHFGLIQKYLRKLGAADLRMAAGQYDRAGKLGPRDAVLRQMAASGSANNYELNMLMRSAFDAKRTAEAAGVATTLSGRLAPAAEPPMGVNIVTILAASGKGAAAQAFVNRWLGPGAKTQDVAAIAPALVDAGAAWAAVAPVRARRGESADMERMYLTVLSHAATTNPGLRAELTRETLAMISRLRPGSALNVEIHRLFTYGDLDIALRELSKSGLWREPQVRNGVIYAFSTKGRGAQLRELLVRDAARPDASLEDRRAAVTDLVNIGFTEDAERLSRELAAIEGPEGESLQTYLYLSSKRSGSVDSAWMISQAGRANGATAIKWIKQIEQATSGDVAIAAIDRIRAGLDESTRGEATFLKARYLGWKGDSPALRNTLSEAAASNLSDSQKVVIATLACAVGDGRVGPKLAATLESGPGGEEMRRCVDRFALDDARTAAAKGDRDAAIARYASVASRTDMLTAQDYVDYAGITATDGNAGRAQSLYVEALRRLPASRDSASIMYLRAVVLSKLDRNDEALEVLDTLLAKWPQNKRARLLTAELLLDGRQYQKALSVANDVGG